MRRLGLLTILAACLLPAQTATGPQVPRRAPEFVINMPDGAQKLLSSLRGKTVAMVFMFTTCPHCQETAAVLSEVQQEYAAKGVQVIGVTFDQGAQYRVREFSQQLQLNFTCGYSTQGQVLEFLQIPVNEPYIVPVIVFIDRAGTIRSEYIGDERFLSHEDLNIRAEIDKMLHGAVPVPRSAPKS